MQAHSPASSSSADARPSEDERQRGLRDEHRARPHERRDLELGGDRDEHLLEVPERLHDAAPRPRRRRRASGARPSRRGARPPSSSTGRRTRSRRGSRASRSSAWCESTPRSAVRRALRLTLTSKLRMPGANATPPPVQCGARVVPARARPVPFWRHGFERPPATRPRLFVPLVPARAAFISARTVSCTRCGFSSTAKTASSRETSFVEPPMTGAFGAAITRSRSPRARSSPRGRSRGRAGGCARRPPRGRRAPAA